jgi:hypothetical protein
VPRSSTTLAIIRVRAGRPPHPRRVNAMGRRHPATGVELTGMRREPSRMEEAAPPVACVGCGADAFALGSAVERGEVLDVELRCGACGAWQRHRLTLAAADRFLDHMALTQAVIARALSAA